MFKLLWKSQSHYGTTKNVQEHADRADASIDSGAAVPRSRNELLEDIKQMRIIIKRMRRTKLIKVFDVVFESEEIKFQEEKQLKKQLKVPK